MFRPMAVYIDQALDPNEHLIQHSATTFFVHVHGDSMQNANFDEINARYDKGAIRFFAEQKEWVSGGRENISPSYTTDWDDLLEI
jgi:hypothetical protein